MEHINKFTSIRPYVTNQHKLILLKTTKLKVGTGHASMVSIGTIVPKHNTNKTRTIITCKQYPKQQIPVSEIIRDSEIKYQHKPATQIGQPPTPFYQFQSHSPTKSSNPTTDQKATV
jgi:hypothetical protein